MAASRRAQRTISRREPTCRFWIETDMAVGGSFDTFPKLLARNAAQFSSRPAFRHKDLGIWQTWSWAQVAEIVRAYAAGLHRLGLQPGDTIALVGSNRAKVLTSRSSFTPREPPVRRRASCCRREAASTLRLIPSGLTA